jgi:hypothetical protein
VDYVRRQTIEPIVEHDRATPILFEPWVWRAFAEVATPRHSPGMSTSISAV